MNMFDLTGKRAIVTGSTSGIGLAIARAFAEAGASVAISSNEAAACASIAAGMREEGLDALPQPCDVASDKELAALVGAATAAWGGIDILVCNAGINTHTGPIGEADDEAYDKMMRINLRSTFKLCNLVIPLMAQHGGGSVIIISSLAGLRGNRTIGLYAMTKAATAQLARNLAVEWGPANVRVNALSPGLIDTPFSDSFKADPAVLDIRLKKTPLRRMGRPEEIAGCAVFLASAAGAFTTGHNLVSDGGTLITD